MSGHSLTILGSGIKSISHITIEGKAYIEKSEAVFYLVNEPILESWIQQQNPRAKSLNFLYDKHPKRTDNYLAISHYIAKNVDSYNSVCLILYGHPSVFSDITTYTIEILENSEHNVCVLPGISAEDCLFADLLIDPASCGCLTYEATDLLLYQRPLNPASHLIIWQVGIIGALGNITNYDNSKGIELLTRYLEKVYPPKHKVTLYEAAQYPHFKSTIETIELYNFSQLNLSPISTLYVPPSQKAECNPLVLAEFDGKLSKN